MPYRSPHGFVPIWISHREIEYFEIPNERLASGEYLQLSAPAASVRDNVQRQSVVLRRVYLKLNTGRQSRFCQSAGRIHRDHR